MRLRVWWEYRRKRREYRRTLARERGRVRAAIEFKRRHGYGP